MSEPPTGEPLRGRKAKDIDVEQRRCAALGKHGRFLSVTATRNPIRYTKFNGRGCLRLESHATRQCVNDFHRTPLRPQHVIAKRSSSSADRSHEYSLALTTAFWRSPSWRERSDITSSRALSSS